MWEHFVESHNLVNEVALLTKDTPTDLVNGVLIFFIILGLAMLFLLIFFLYQFILDPRDSEIWGQILQISLIIVIIFSIAYYELAPPRLARDAINAESHGGIEALLKENIKGNKYATYLISKAGVIPPDLKGRVCFYSNLYRLGIEKEYDTDVSNYVLLTSTAGRTPNHMFSGPVPKDCYIYNRLRSSVLNSEKYRQLIDWTVTAEEGFRAETWRRFELGYRESISDRLEAITKGSIEEHIIPRLMLLGATQKNPLFIEVKYSKSKFKGVRQRGAGLKATQRTVGAIPKIRARATYKGLTLLSTKTEIGEAGSGQYEIIDNTLRKFVVKPLMIKLDGWIRAKDIAITPPVEKLYIEEFGEEYVWWRYKRNSYRSDIFSDPNPIIVFE